MISKPTTQLLARLESASPQEREWILTEDLLSSLDPTLQAAAWAAAIPHWFDVSILAALLDKQVSEVSKINELYHQLQQLPFVEECYGKGHYINPIIRELMLKYLWKNNRNQFQQYSDKAAKYFAPNQFASNKFDPHKLPEWQIEWLYHLVINKPKKTVEQLSILPVTWERPIQVKLETLIQRLKEHIEGDRVVPIVQEKIAILERLTTVVRNTQPQIKSQPPQGIDIRIFIDFPESDFLTEGPCIKFWYNFDEISVVTFATDRTQLLKDIVMVNSGELKIISNIPMKLSKNLPFSDQIKKETTFYNKHIWKIPYIINKNELITIAEIEIENIDKPIEIMFDFNIQSKNVHLVSQDNSKPPTRVVSKMALFEQLTSSLKLKQSPENEKKNKYTLWRETMLLAA